MDGVKPVGVSLLLLSAAALAWGVATGEVRLSLFLVFPIFSGTTALAVLSFLGIFGGIALYFWGRVRETAASARAAWAEGEREAPGTTTPAPNPGEPGVGRARGGGIVLIGPIPIVWGSDWRYATVAIAMAILLVLVVVALVRP